MNNKAYELRALLAGKLGNSMTVLQSRNLDMKWNDFSTIRTDAELQVAIRYCDNPQTAPFKNCNAFRIVHACPFVVLYGIETEGVL